jgi:hypothetical protein
VQLNDGDCQLNKIDKLPNSDPRCATAPAVTPNSCAADPAQVFDDLPTDRRLYFCDFTHG